MGLKGAHLRDRRGVMGRVDSPDIQLRHHRVFFSFTDPENRYDEISADLEVAVAFRDAMQISNMTVPMHGMLWNIAARVYEVIGLLSKPTK